MKYIASLIMIAFAGILLFGFIPMEHVNHHNGGSSGTTCPIVAFFDFACTGNASSMAMAHISTLQSFSNVPPTTFFSFLGIVFICAYLWIHYRFLQKEYVSPIGYRRSQHFLATIGTLSFAIWIQSWLSLFEYSPS